MLNWSDVTMEQYMSDYRAAKVLMVFQQPYRDYEP